MSSLGAWIWGTSQLDDAVDKATSELLPAGGEDIALNLEICDQIRSKSVPAKDAMRALKRRLNHKNPNVQLLALGLTDNCIKNGGDPFLVEIASREFIDNIVSILKVPALNHDVKTNILRLVQNWSVAFEGRPGLSYVGQVYKTLTNEGYKFPPKDPVVSVAAMVDTQTAPDWIDSEVCLRCRTAFTFTNRKHHCRNCGLVFDQLCSSKTMALPHFGITQEVRVCDGCHGKLTKKGERTTRRYSTGFQGQRHRSARELADAELQRAIQLSLQEVNGTNGQAHPGYVPYQPSTSRWGYSEPPLVDHSTYPDTKSPISEEEDPDLRAAIEASLREANAPKPSAPVAAEASRFEERTIGSGNSQSRPEISQSAIPKVPSYELAPLEADAILTFNQTVEHVQAQGGRDISRYPAVTELYDKATGLRPKLALSLDDTGRKEQMLSDMNDKLSQAVKLYDQILTQQIAQPRWRTTAVSPTPYQQQNFAGYSQWAPQVQNSTNFQAPLETPLSPQFTYTSPPPTHSQLPDWGQLQQPQYQSPRHRASSPPEMIASQIPAPPSQYAQPLQHQHYASIPNTSHSVHSYNQPQSNQVMSVQATDSFAPTVPVFLPQSPLPTQYQYPTPQAPVPLSTRANSVTYTSATPTSHIARNNTIASHGSTQQSQVPPHQQHHHQQHQRQPHQIASSPAPPSLPQFPVVPTAAPQATFSTYGSTISSGFEERKEALLIDL